MIAAVRAHSDQDVVALASSNIGRARELAQAHNIDAAYDSVHDLLADPEVEVVYASTTYDLHCGQVIAAAKAGKNVLCERPLGLSVEDATRIVDTCSVNGVVMATNHHLRNAATHRKVREFIQAGVVGQPLFCACLSRRLSASDRAGVANHEPRVRMVASYSMRSRTIWIHSDFCFRPSQSRRWE